MTYSQRPTFKAHTKLIYSSAQSREKLWDVFDHEDISGCEMHARCLYSDRLFFLVQLSLKHIFLILDIFMSVLKFH